MPSPGVASHHPDRTRRLPRTERLERAIRVLVIVGAGLIVAGSASGVIPRHDAAERIEEGVR